MATVKQAICTCDVCGKMNDAQTWAFGFDGKRYEIDLCPEDGNGLGKVVAGYISKGRKVATGQGQRRNGRRPRSPRATAAIGDGASAPGGKRSTRGRVISATREEARTSRPWRQAAKVRGAKAKAAGSDQEAAAASRSQPQKAKAASKQAAKANGMQREKGVYVYGILPADIELAAEMPGVGEHPGPLGVVRSDGLAALISEVSLTGRLGSSEDLRTHREILDSTAVEVPVLPLRFGTVLTGEGAVADELLAPHHDEFAAALERLEGCAEFLVRSRYVQEAVLGEVLSENKQAAQLRDTIQGKGPGAARDARAELGAIVNEVVAAKREEDTRALRQAMEGVCVASVVREPAHELDAVHVAFLVAVDRESEVERVIGDLAGEWEGRIEVQLLGPMAAYDFVQTADSG